MTFPRYGRKSVGRRFMGMYVYSYKCNKSKLMANKEKAIKKCDTLSSFFVCFSFL